jgi:hypothetical protein
LRRAALLANPAENPAETSSILSGLGAIVLETAQTPPLTSLSSDDLSCSERIFDTYAKKLFSPESPHPLLLDYDFAKT